MGDSSVKNWIVEYNKPDSSTWYDVYLLSGVRFDKLGIVTEAASRYAHSITSYQYRGRNIVTGELYYAHRGFVAPSVPEQLGPPAKVDMKAGLRDGKPKLSRMPYDALVYAARAFEWGESPGKYEQGNFLLPTPDTLAAFDRLMGYLDAALRHAQKLTLSMSRARGTGDKSDAQLRAAAMATDPDGGLPHLCGLAASVLMAIQQAVDSGLIATDPGRPWEKK